MISAPLRAAWPALVFGFQPRHIEQVAERLQPVLAGNRGKIAGERRHVAGGRGAVMPGLGRLRTSV